MTFFTSDTHFYHNPIIYFAHRPFKDAYEMNEIFIKNWNEKVSKNDIVYHLGDFAFASYQSWKYTKERLNGTIHLILGNHDRRNCTQHQLESLFETVSYEQVLNIDNYKIYLNHFPFLCFPGGYHNDHIQLFGHVHTEEKMEGLDKPRLEYLYKTQYDVGVDNNNYKPVEWSEIKTILKNR
jgi:calcineurin-like phosphoesterase family protein